ncbi:MAG: AAA family ATPase [bacterium]|nr:AAA family ATPase [bacterium]
MAAERRTFVFGDFELDEARRELRRRGDLVALHPTPFRLLQHLIHRRDRVVSRAELLEVVWPEVVVSDSAISSALKEIRSALGDDGKRQRWVQTLRGRGLRFVGEVECGVGLPVASRAEIPQTAVTTFLCIEAAGSSRSPPSTADPEAVPSSASIDEQLKTGVASHAGAELRWSGDGRLVAFGDVSDGVRCAIDLQQIARPRRGDGQGALCMGVHVGPAPPRSPGEASFGTPAVLASRLCDAAAEGEILVSGAVAGLLAGRRAFRFEDRGSRAFEGFATSVPVFAVLYEADAIVPLRARLRFVGRDAELTRLERALDRARTGRGGLLLVAGEPGIGKTRLVEEFERHATRRGVRVLVGRCREGEGERTYGPFADALAELVQETDETRLVAALGPYGAALVPLIPALRRVLPGLPDLPVIPGDEARERLFDAVAALLLSVSEGELLVIIVDDLQWADLGTLAMLGSLARRARAGRLLLVGTYRSTEVDAGHPLSELVESDTLRAKLDLLQLGGLEKHPVRELLESVTGGDVPDALVALMTLQTAGNPLFIRELLIQMMVEGKLGPERGVGWPEGLPVDDLGIPDGVRQVVGRRLGRLSELTSRLLTVASGFHGEFSFRVTRRVLDVEEASALDALDEALDAGIVRSLGGDTYGFTHDVIRQTVLSVLNPSRQLGLHRRIAAEMEHAWGEAPERVGEIAWQYHRSRGLPGAERGVRFCLAAADHAESGAAPDETARFLRMARDLLPEGDARRAQILPRLAFALAWSMASPEDAVEAALEASDVLAEVEGHDAAAEFLADLSALVRPQSKPPAWRLATEGLRHIGTGRNLTWARLSALGVCAAEGH